MLCLAGLHLSVRQQQQIKIKPKNVDKLKEKVEKRKKNVINIKNVKKNVYYIYALCSVAKCFSTFARNREAARCSNKVYGI